MTSRMTRAASMSGIAPSRPYPTSILSFRSCRKTSTIAPSSRPLWPTRHFSARRIEKSSRLSPSSEGKIATTTWAPCSPSPRSSVCSSRVRASGGSAFAKSLTRVVGAGGTTRATRRRSAGSRLELHARGRRRVGRRFEERLRREGHQPRDDAAGEELEARVVVPHGVVEALALDGDAILGALELALQREEVLVRFQLGIALDGDEQPAQRARQLLLRRLEPLHRLGIVEGLGREGHAARPRAGLGH